MSCLRAVGKRLLSVACRCPGTEAEAGLIGQGSGWTAPCSGAAIHSSTQPETVRMPRFKPVLQAEVQLPDGVTVLRQGCTLVFEGPLGSNVLNLQRIDSQGLGGFSVGDTSVKVCGPSLSFLKTVESLLQSKLKGVTQGYLVYLQLVGIGYRAGIVSDNEYQDGRRSL